MIKFFQILIKFLCLSLKTALESGLYIHSVFIQKLELELRGRLRSSNKSQNLEKYNPKLTNDYIIEYRDLSKGVFFLCSIFYSMSLMVFMIELYLKRRHKKKSKVFEKRKINRLLLKHKNMNYLNKPRII